MILNLSYFEDDIAAYLSESSDLDDIVDFTGVVNAASIQNKVRNVRKEDGAFGMEERAIARYTVFCGEVSRLSTRHGNTRDIKVNNLPVHWLTDLAVKHYEIHWLSAVFFLEEALHSGVLQGRDAARFKVIMPKNAGHSRTLLQQIFNKHGMQRPQIVSRGGNSEFFYFARFVKELLLNLVGFFKLKQSLRNFSSRGKGLAGSNIILVNIYASIWEKAKWENYWSEHYAFFSSKATTWITPFFNRYSGSTRYDFSKTPDDFVAALPDYTAAVSVALQAFSAYAKSFFKFRGSNCYLGVEQRKALSSLGYFLSHEWYSNFSRRLTSQCLAVYDEEMYYAGRTLSHAFKVSANPGLTYVGLQHGLFFNPNHTVYTITDLEVEDLSKGDGLPLPQKFIAWGDFFKKEFLENNSLPEDFVVPLGSIKHSMTGEAYSSVIVGHSTITTILWCTTLVQYVKSEFEVMWEALKNYGKHINLVIRKHPYVPLSDEALLQLFEDLPLQGLSISANKNIQEDLAKADVIISTSGSTTFLDALLAHKLSIRIYNHASYPALQHILTSSSFFIYHAEEFTHLLQKILHKDLFLTSQRKDELNDYIYVGKDRWENFIYHALRPTEISKP